MKTNQLTIAIGSCNPVKINATTAAFQAYFPGYQIKAIAVNAPSGVSEQPMTANETLIGAINRVNYCLTTEQQKATNIDYYVAIEGGVEKYQYGVAGFAYVVISNKHQQVVGKSAELPLPESVFQALTQGRELGDVIDELFNTENAKQKTGAMGLFTNNLVTRQSTYQQAIVLALAKLVNAHLYD